MKVSRLPKTLKQRLSRCDSRLVEAILKVAHAVAEYPGNPFGRPPRAFLVGGIVRDLLRGDVTATDADLEIYGIPAELLEAMMRPLFPEADLSTVGRAFGILKIHLGDGLELDIAIPRRESKVREGHRGFEIVGDPNLEPEQAARRRDFTVNAISLDPLNGALIDPMHGTFDLEENVLRVVDAATFGDDPLRALRAVQFVARFGLHVEAQTLAILKDMAASDEFHALSPERVTDEWKKLFLKSDTPSRGLELAWEIGLRDFPVVLLADSCATICSREQLSPDERLIALLAITLEQLNPSERKRLFERMTFSRNIEEAVDHLLPQLPLVSQTVANLNGLRVLLKHVLPAPVNAFFAVVSATGRLRPAQATSWRRLIREADLEQAAQTTLLRGQDLIALGLPTGPRIGEWIDYVERLRDMGALETREQALHTVQEQLALCPSPPPLMPANDLKEK